jgi:hypothetical protein
VLRDHTIRGQLDNVSSNAGVVVIEIIEATVVPCNEKNM